MRSRADDQARDWRAMIGEEDDGELMVAVFCPDCADREFSDGTTPTDLR